MKKSDYTKVWGREVDAYGNVALAGGLDHLYYGAVGGESPGLYAFSLADGTIAWHVEEKVDMVTRPAVARDAVVILTEEALRCFDPANGTERWHRSSEGIGPQLSLVDDILYTTHNGKIRALRSVTE